MRILFVNPYYKPYLGGIERIIEHLSTELLAHPVVEAVGVLTTRVYFPDRVIHDLPEYEVIDGVEVFRCTFRPVTLPRVFHAALAGYVSMDVARVLRQFRPDIVHFTYSEWWSANLFTYLASRQTPHILSTFFHDLPLVKRTLPLYKTNRWLVQRMRAIHVLSEVERQQVHRAYGAPLRRTIVIPPGVDVPMSAPDRTQRDPGVVTILAVGRLNEHKAQLELVKMLDHLIQEPALPQIRLWLAGDDAGAGKPISDFVAQQGLASAVKVVGRCSDEELRELYRYADIFALPTQYESFGLVFIEAMAYGLPVVTYGVGPVPSILTEGALIVPPGDERAFLDALRTLVLQPDIRHRLGNQGRAMVRSLYSWHATGERFLELYKRLLSRQTK